MKSHDGRDCSSFHQNKVIVLDGKRTSTLRLLNPNERHVEQIEVDGCAIEEGPRCDWLLRVLEHPTIKAACVEEIYIELKGAHVSRAVAQLRASIERLSLDRKKLPKRCLVVHTRNPMIGSDAQKLKVQFTKEFGARFLLVRNQSHLEL